MYCSHVWCPVPSISNTLETESFINALRHFQAEHRPKSQRSDRGTNFVGAQRELQKALSEMDEDKVRNTLLEENCEWVSFKMNPPAASHIGGSWERQIRTVRSVLSSLLEEAGHQLDDESFRTLLKEVQAVVNSRPLALNDMSSPDSPEQLTPNHLDYARLACPFVPFVVLRLDKVTKSILRLISFCIVLYFEFYFHIFNVASFNEH